MCSTEPMNWNCGDLVDQVHVVQALDAVEVALMDRVDPHPAGLSERLREAAFSDGHLYPARRSKRESPNRRKARAQRARAAGPDSVPCRASVSASSPASAQRRVNGRPGAPRRSRTPPVVPTLAQQAGDLRPGQTGRLAQEAP